MKRGRTGVLSKTVLAVGVATILSLAGAASCGGDGGSGPITNPGPGPGTPPAVNPCADVSQEAPAAETAARVSSDKRETVYGDTRWTSLDHKWTHRAASERRSRSGEVAVEPRDRTVGEIAVIEDDGQIVVAANQFDLRARGLRFRPNTAGGYDVSTVDAAFRAPLGSRLTLDDDDSSASTVPFAFPLFGQVQTSAFINSDGNVTFGEGDTSSTARNITRFLSGPPRVAPFFSDLDPSAGGSVWVNAASDAFTVTWCGVRGFESTSSVTVQTTLLPDGTVDIEFGDAPVQLASVVGLSPGRTTAFSAVDLSAGASGAGRVGIAERFSMNAELDLVAASRRFFAAHPDSYDQLVFWTDTRVVSDAFAFETTIANNIQGIGVNLSNESRDYGSQGRLSSLVVMDALTKYPDDPRQRFLGENNTVSVLGQESGHRFLVYLRFLDVNRRVSEDLLGRDNAHWSFFVDSNASVMEGNDIEDLGGGAFRTVGAVSRYSRVDMYAMGLAAANEVPSFFYVASPTNTSPNVSGKDAAPRIGVTFNGTRRDVRLQDIIDVVGRRQPSSAEAPKVMRQAFVYVVGGGRSVDANQVEKLDRIRTAWETFYSGAVERRGRVETRLN
jgi:hypothetical protein